MNRVLGWMETAKIPENAAILDIGTGNGAFLVELVRKEIVQKQKKICFFFCIVYFILYQGEKKEFIKKDPLHSLFISILNKIT